MMNFPKAKTHKSLQNCSMTQEIVNRANCVKIIRYKQNVQPAPDTWVVSVGKMMKLCNNSELTETFATAQQPVYSKQSLLYIRLHFLNFTSMTLPQWITLLYESEEMMSVSPVQSTSRYQNLFCMTNFELVSNWTWKLIRLLALPRQHEEGF